MARMLRSAFRRGSDYFLHHRRCCSTSSECLPISVEEFQDLSASCGLPFDNFKSVPRIVPTLPNKIGIAFSGGADSTSLAILLSEYKRKLYQDEGMTVDVVALTVDHGLRDESIQEARIVSTCPLQFPKQLAKIMFSTPFCTV